MQRLKLITTPALLTGLLVTPLARTASQAGKAPAKLYQPQKAPPRRRRATAELPDDSALPGLMAIREAYLAGAIMFPGNRPIELVLRGYTPGSRATLEARAGRHRVAFKAYPENSAPEAALYEALATAGLAGTTGVRVPPLLAWDPNLRVLVMGWLEGPTARELVKTGQGKRAGDLGARWIQQAASLPVKLGPPLAATAILCRSRQWVAALGAVDPALGAAATVVAAKLGRTQPKEGVANLVHGTLYDCHVLDLGDGPGVIDWQRFGQGPLELDAGMFLATIWRIALRDEPFAGEAASAEQAFLAGTASLLDKRTLAWYRAAALLRIAANKVRVVKRRKVGWRARAYALLGEASQFAEAAG